MDQEDENEAVLGEPSKNASGANPRDGAGESNDKSIPSGMNAQIVPPHDAPVGQLIEARRRMMSGT